MNKEHFVVRIDTTSRYLDVRVVWTKCSAGIRVLEYHGLRCLTPPTLYIRHWELV